MRRTTAVCAALFTLFATAAPAEANIICNWTSSDLGMPQGIEHASVQAAGPNGYLAGRAGTGMLLLWHNGELIVPPAPVSISISIAAVNGRGEIVGYDGRTETAFVQRDGAFQTLPMPAGYRAFATSINEAGDIAGAIHGGTPARYRSIVWKRNQPGTYQIVADDVAVGIDDAGRVVTEKGLVWSPDGTTTRLPGSPDMVVQLFQRGHILGHVFGDNRRLRRWDVTGAEVHRYDMASPLPFGINTRGQLLTAYDNSSGEVSVGVWRRTSFAGDVGADARPKAVTETHELAGFRFDGGRVVPAIWTCT